MINAAALLFCTFVAQSGDQTVLSAAERFFLQSDFIRASELIDSHIWSEDSVWSRAGLIRELCDGGWNVACPLMASSGVHPGSCSVRVSLTGEFSPGDSVRVFLPIPAELPWQFPAGTPSISLTGINGEVGVFQGWLFVSGEAAGSFEVTLHQMVDMNPCGFAGIDAPGVSEAMVPFPGEDPFTDRCLDTEVFWAGTDPVYLESVRLAAGEPNPMRLIQRIISRSAALYEACLPVNEQVLLRPASALALDNNLQNSMGAASLGASVFRRWQIPALAVPGRFGSDGAPGFLLAAYIKPYGWMVVSPFPEGFTAMGSFDPPPMKSWFNGISGISFQAEYRGDDGFWHAVPVNAQEFSHSVEITVE